MKKFIYSIIFFVLLTLALFIMDHADHSKFVTYWHARWYFIILGYVIGAAGPFAYEEYIEKTAGDPNAGPVFLCWVAGILLIVFPWALSMGS